MHKKQRGKNEESNTNINSNIKTFPIKIKILLAYLEKILYLWAVEKVGLKKKTRSWKKTSTGHQHCGIPQKTGHLCWMTSNAMNDVTGIRFRANEQRTVSIGRM